LRPVDTSGTIFWVVTKNTRFLGPNSGVRKLALPSIRSPSSVAAATLATK